jgi:predicted Abi (CAAX) family protease
MKAISIAILISLFSACATTEYQLRDTKNRTPSEHIIDDRECSRYHYQGSSKFLDREYYYACMDLKGYKLETVGTPPPR